MKVDIKRLCTTVLIIVIISLGCAVRHYESGYGHYQLGVAFHQSNYSKDAESEFKKAVEESTQALKRDISLKEAYVVRGGAWLYLSQKDKALQDLLIAHHIDVETKGWVKPLANVLLGNLYYKSGSDVREERRKLEKELRDESDSQKKEDIKKEIFKQRFKEIAFYNIALDFYKQASELKDVPINIQINALHDAILCHYALRGAAKLIDDKNSVQLHTQTINELSARLLNLDNTDPIAHHFIGMEKSELPDMENQQLALKHLICASSIGLPEVLRFENEDRIKEIFSSLAEMRKK